MMTVIMNEITMRSNLRMGKGWRRIASSLESHQHSFRGRRGSRHTGIVEGTVAHVTEVEEKLVDALHLDTLP
jgi:hypothetical protein